ncbi:hypothetical protein NGM29_06100 [Natronosalvus rutilus]|uniref:DUF7982 domain-containing protein n=2 Tax=Natronosalvus rutilus TaxID=2953753 RepID=A0A9E7SVU9_9EURY|nr:hypothetical protein [Natronosalvus rutilus]UTF54835.1 hypothetical protein NGM29_06100 [Natronosalvus rutilus]
MSMSNSDPESTTAEEADEGPAAEGAADHLDRRAQLEVLAEENRRLRTEYARARQSRYRQTALGLAAVGLVAVLGGLVFPDGREVLFVLGATGFFGGVLTYFLTPAHVVAADVGERVYAAGAANGAALVEALGLSETRRYVPMAGSVRLFVPHSPDDVLTDLSDHAEAGPFLLDDPRGLLLEATGQRLFDEFERALSGDLAATPTPLTTQLTDGLCEHLELARHAEVDVDADRGRATIAITESAFGDVDRFDHPIASFLVVGLATGLDRPVTLEVAPGDDRADWLVTCRWDSDNE